MNIAGIDGCRKGWLMVKYSNNNYTFGVYENITEMLKNNKALERILIDIPLGLGSSKIKRTVENELRQELKYKHSSVFNPPCREALYEIDYETAKLKNSEIEKRSLSIQSYNIFSKIKELDVLLNNKPIPEIIESHPELCFKYLNGGNVVLSKKSQKVGQNERKEILFQYDSKLKTLFKSIEINTLRKDVAYDDIADAICLCLVNRLGFKNRLSFITDINSRDENRSAIRIAYYKPYN